MVIGIREAAEAAAQPPELLGLLDGEELLGVWCGFGRSGG